MRRSRLVCVAAVVGLVAVGCRPTTTDNAATACLARPNVVAVTGNHTTRYEGGGLPANTTVNATGATFTGSSTPSESKYPVTFEGTTAGFCMVNGTISMVYDYTTTPWTTWHSTTALLVDGPSFSSVNLRENNDGDGIAFNEHADGFQVIGAKLTGIHDDCIQDDGMAGGTIDDSYMECYSAFSARGFTGYVKDGTGKTLTIKNSLVWAKAQPTSFNDSGPGVFGFFKWSNSPTSEGTPPALHLENMIFRADAPALNFGNSTGNLDFAPTYRNPANPNGPRLPWPITCTNVQVVWTGIGAYPGNLGGCATVTTDLSVWTNAVNTYNTDHP